MLATPTSGPTDFATRRRPQVDESLGTDTIKWLAQLPAGTRPRELPVAFVRITNRVARVWGDPAACLACFDDLLIDYRGTRRGFPMAIALELATLKDYYETKVHPVPQTAWECISGKGKVA
jgi:hypothetical protein